MKGVADIGESARVTMRPEPQGVEIQVSDAAPEGVAAAVERGLTEHTAQARVADRLERPLSVVARGADSALLGALLGRTVWGWLHIRELWVAPAHQRRGLGRQLVRAAEDAARARGCHAAYLDTFDFQALPFYQRLDYAVFGALEDFPAGHTRYFLQRRLADAGPRLRTATERDAPALARFAERSFRGTFASDNSPGDMDQHCAAHFGAERQLAEIRDARMSTLLAEDGTALIAFGQLRHAPAPACVSGERPGEIHRLYVDRAWHGRGLAQRLLGALVEQAFAAGADGVWLGVWERNPRAIRFYERSGFETVGEHVFVVGADRQRDLVMQYRGARPAAAP
ncbi:MAG: GNAT family N-acetyltransferase [Steroidobacteraceae bacterium]